AEGAEAEAVALALVRALVGRRRDDRVHVVYGDAGRVLADAAVLVLDLPLHRPHAVVGRRARRARRAAEGAVARAAVEGVLEAGRGVGAGRVVLAGREEGDVGALVHRPFVREGGVRSYVAHVRREPSPVLGAGDAARPGGASAWELGLHYNAYRRRPTERAGDGSCGLATRSW